ncbi:DNA-binding domain-containing protein [Roseibium polysiphoniae]|uniref:HvfC/BufC N-terminal domain-containing protein n=1 Tax=Roseibium polysiphoniae TaxID=2571221 RepID=UPI001FE4D20D|nr:DNA-binding domain-containing protein [Roseibium polysiphoniae]
MSADGQPAALALPEFGEALLDTSLPVPSGVVGPDGKPAPKRFSVYRNNVVVSLVEAIEQTFPSVQRMIGEDYFKALARAFVVENPPQSPVLMWYGAEFPAFLETFEPLAAYPYLTDVARIEWNWLQAYHAEDATPLSPEELAEVAPDALGNMTFKIHPAAIVVESAWPILSFVAVNRFLPDDDMAIDLKDAQSVLITRPDLDVELMLLRPGGALFLEQLRSGSSLGQAAEAASAGAESFDLSGVLTDFLSAGVFRTLAS